MTNINWEEQKKKDSSKEKKHLCETLNKVI